MMPCIQSVQPRKRKQEHGSLTIADAIMKLFKGYSYAVILFWAAIISSSGTAGAPSAARLEFEEFFAQPIGPRGLVVSDKLRSLDGKQVRISGYVVQQDSEKGGLLLMTTVPVQLHDEHYGLADDLPAATLFVHLNSQRSQKGVSARGKIEVSGTLSIGAREEIDGRISLVRLMSATVLHPAEQIDAANFRKGKPSAKNLNH
jgi:hypothetical protein